MMKFYSVHNVMTVGDETATLCQDGVVSWSDS